MNSAAVLAARAWIDAFHLLLRFVMDVSTCKCQELLIVKPHSSRKERLRSGNQVQVVGGGPSVPLVSAGLTVVHAMAEPGHA